MSKPRERGPLEVTAWVVTMTLSYVLFGAVLRFLD